MSLKVAVLGASGGIGQPLCLLLKQCPLIKTLALYDLKTAAGVAKDLSHINTPCKTNGYNELSQIKQALTGSHVVVLLAGIARQPNMSRDDLFKTNATIVKELSQEVGKHCPKSLYAIVTNPINIVIPIACEVLKKAGAFDRARVFGVTTLDLVRASVFVAEEKKLNSKDVYIPCIGGHSPDTIIPVFSQAKPAVELSNDKLEAITKKVQNAGTEVVKAKAGAGSATLSTAYATARFTIALLKGLTGEKNVIESAYIRSDTTEVKYFANEFVLGKNGIEKNLGHGTLNEREMKLVKTAIPILKTNIKKGEDFAKS